MSQKPESSFSKDSKYLPLHEFFANLPASTESREVSFAEVEDVIGQPLPSGARSHRAWWGNGWSGHSQSRAWLLAGWKMVGVDIEGEIASFQRLT